MTDQRDAARMTAVGDDLAVRAVRMDASARTAGALAHEVANYLGTVRTMLYLLKDEVEAGSAAAADLETVDRTLDAGLQFLQDLRAFVHPQPLGAGVSDLDALLEDAEPVLRGLVANGAALRVLPSGAALLVRADGVALERLVRMIVSAASAGAEPGETISLRTEPAGSTGVPLVQVVVHRDRRAIAPERLARIFEPFVADRAHDTGLLLPVVYAIVTSSGGTMAALSEPGIGMTLRIGLPAAESPGGAGGVP